MSDRWQDYTKRVRFGNGKRAHLVSQTGYYSACGLAHEAYIWRAALDGAPLCKICQRLVEAAKRREGQNAAHDD